MTLGWKPSMTWKEGIEQTVGDYLYHRYDKPRTNQLSRFKVLVFGHNGWLGSRFVQHGASKGWEMVRATTKPGLSTDQDVESEILVHKYCAHLTCVRTRRRRMSCRCWDERTGGDSTRSTASPRKRRGPQTTATTRPLRLCWRACARSTLSTLRTGLPLDVLTQQVHWNWMHLSV